MFRTYLQSSTLSRYIQCVIRLGSRNSPFTDLVLSSLGQFRVPLSVGPITQKFFRLITQHLLVRKL
jgi:hypothetical protein